LAASPFLLALLIAAGYPLVNWYADRQADGLVAEWNAAGLPTTLEESLGSSSDEDFSRHPAVKSEFSRLSGDRLESLKNMSISWLSKDRKVWDDKIALGQRSDIREWVDPARLGDSEQAVANDLLVLLDSEIRRLADMDEAFDRQSECWWFIDSSNREPSSNLVQMMGLIGFMADLATIRMTAGDADGACELIGKMTKARNLLLAKPSAMIVIVSATIEQRIYAVIWQGADRDLWDESHLRQFLASKSPYTSQMVSASFESEMGCFLHYGIKPLPDLDPIFGGAPDWEKLGTDAWDAVSDWDWDGVRKVGSESWLKARPRGFWTLEQVAGIRALNSERKRMAGAGTLPIGAPEDFSGMLSLGDDMWASLAKRSVQFAKRSQIVYSLWTTGAALELYQLQHGQAPSALEALVPDYLSEVPIDLCDGKQLRYQVLPDGSPHVWTIWPSGVDEGGMPAKRGNKGNLIWTTGKIPGLTKAVFER
jgi:hypothetical protein